MRALTAAIAAIVLVATASVAYAGGKTYTTALTGAAEVPGPGDPDGSGTATVTINSGKGEICYEISVSGIAPAIAAHIHVGDAVTAGPVVVGLGAPTGGSSSGCVAVDRELARAIAKNPTQYYVNVHTSEYPAGAVRGQLR